MIDLNPNHLATVEAILAEHVPECEVRAFGSRAAWTARDYSDLDLAVVGQGPLDWRTLGRLKEAFEESTLPMRVDVLDWHAIPENFREVIRRDYAILQNRASADGADLPGQWREATLGQLGRIITGKTPSSRRPEYYGGDIPFVTPRDFNGRRRIESTERYLTKKGMHAVKGAQLPSNAVMVSCIGSDMGKAAITVEPCVTNQQINSIVVDPHNDPLFVYYNLSNRKDEIRGAAGGSAQPILNKSGFGQLSIVLPPPHEQRAIAHVLGTLDDKIELNRRMNQTLEEMARALFKSWFVDFDPVRAKMDGRDTGLPSDIAALFPDRLVASELGEVPEGWGVKVLGDVVTRLRDNENPVVSPDTVFSHFSIPAYDEGQTPKHELGESIKSAKSRVPPGVVLLSKLNPEIERVWLPDVAYNERAICSTEFLVFEPRSPYSRSYVYCLARSPLFRRQIESLVTGTSKSHQRAPVNAILELNVVTPPARVIEVFEMSAAEFLDRTLACRRESRLLAAQRDALLPKLVSGEVMITDLERFSIEESQ